MKACRNCATQSAEWAPRWRTSVLKTDVKSKAKRPMPAKASAKTANGRDKHAVKPGSAKAEPKKDSQKADPRQAAKAQPAKAAAAKPVAGKAPAQKGGVDQTKAGVAAKAVPAKGSPAKGEAGGKGADKRSDKPGLRAGL